MERDWQLVRKLLRLRTKLSLIKIHGTGSTKSLMRNSSTDLATEMSEKIDQEKTALRQEAKRRLLLLSPEEKTRQSEIVRNKLFNNEVYKTAKRISVFLSINDEIQTLPILKDMLTNGKAVFIPRYSTGKMCSMAMVRLNSWEDYESLPTTRWNIKQPALDDPRESVLETGNLQLVIMPGLAFTRNGDRLGRGKGHYDSFLNTYANVQKQKPHTIAVAFKEQIFPHIPTSNTDFKINEVIFEGE